MEVYLTCDLQLEQALEVSEKDVKDASTGVLQDLKRFQRDKEADLRRYMVSLLFFFFPGQAQTTRALLLLYLARQKLNLVLGGLRAVSSRLVAEESGDMDRSQGRGGQDRRAIEKEKEREREREREREKD